MVITGILLSVTAVDVQACSTSLSEPGISQPSRVSGYGYPRSLIRLAQNTDQADDSSVPPDRVEKYVAVYKDMQRDRSLTVEMAAAKEGLSLGEFRDLEQKIERDEAAREHVRAELQSAAGK